MPWDYKNEESKCSERNKGDGQITKLQRRVVSAMRREIEDMKGLWGTRIGSWRMKNNILGNMLGLRESVVNGPTFMKGSSFRLGSSSKGQSIVWCILGKGQNMKGLMCLCKKHWKIKESHWRILKGNNIFAF